MTRLLALVALVVLAAAPPLGAHLTVSAEFREVVHEATLIVRGRITDVRAIAVPDLGVESVGTIAVDAVLKGERADFVSIRVPGGRIGRYRYVMTGAPTLTAGQQALFFLKQGPDGAWRPIGLTQGIYRLQAEPATGRPVVRPPLVAGQTAPIAGRTVRGDVRRRLMPVPEFESLVRFVMASPPRQAIPRGARR